MHFLRKTRSIRSRLLVMSAAVVFLFSSFTACDDSEDSGSVGTTDYEKLYVISAFHFTAASPFLELQGWNPLAEVNRDKALWYSVVAYRLTYDSVDPDGNDVRATCLVMVPHDFSVQLDFDDLSDATITEAKQNRPMLVLQHGTIFGNENAPSQVDFDLIEGSFTEGIIEAGNGYFTVVPDGIGFGPTQDTHVRPYVFGPTYATDNIYAMRAAKDFAGAIGVSLNGKLFLKGYSEGGYATIALQHAIESDADLYDEFPLTAVSAGAGPYDIVDIGRQSFENLSNGGSEPEMNYPAYFPFVGNAYRAWAGVDSFTNRGLDTIFNNDPPTNYADNIPGWYENAELTGDEIDAQITGVISEFMDTDFVDGFLDESGSSTEQDVLDMFADQSYVSVETGESTFDELLTPTQIAHCNDDTTIFVTGAETLAADLASLGGAAVTDSTEGDNVYCSENPSECTDPHSMHTTCQWLVKPLNYFANFNPGL